MTVNITSNSMDIINKITDDDKNNLILLYNHSSIYDAPFAALSVFKKIRTYKHIAKNFVLPCDKVYYDKLKFILKHINCFPIDRKNGNNFNKLLEYLKSKPGFLMAMCPYGNTTNRGLSDIKSGFMKISENIPNTYIGIVDFNYKNHTFHIVETYKYDKQCEPEKSHYKLAKLRDSMLSNKKSKVISPNVTSTAKKIVKMALKLFT